MSILTTAEEIINGQRAKDYGDARENHQRIADLWNVYLQNEPGSEVTPEDVGVMMILLKIARFMENGYHHDTVVDIAGYAGVLEKMQLPDGERYAHKIEWKDGLDEFEAGEYPIWDKAAWERGDVSYAWEGEGPGGEPYTEEGPFTSAKPKQPRKWELLEDVPTDVRVVDKDGDVWVYHTGAVGTGWGYRGRPTRSPLSDYRDCGPFTEIREGCL